MKHVYVFLTLLALAGCAEQPQEHRFLTPEQDATVAKKCIDGCAVVPKPAWEAILRALAAKSGVGI